MEGGDSWNARVGDEISVHSHRLGGAQRTGVIREVLGTTHDPYFRVRWQDGRETTLHPGPDALLRPKGRRPRTAARRSRAASEAAQPGPAGSHERTKLPGGLRASPGDCLLIKGHRLGEPTRDAEILETLGPDGSAPFRVRWSDTGRETVLFPGSDAGVEHFKHGARPR